MLQRKLLCSAFALLLLSACASIPPAHQAATGDITIFSFNDFHGNLQADKPVPYMAPIAALPESASVATHGHTHAAEKTSTPSGGYAYLASVLKQRRALAPASILVGGGDLIGASPLGSAMLRDEPVIAALNQIGLSVTAVGNHEFDGGAAELKRKIAGDCPAAGCAFPGYSGAKFDYLGANVSDKDETRPWLKPYVIRQVGDFKVAFIGAVTKDTPNLVAGDGVKNLRFEDEASAINRYVPEILQQGVAVIVLLIHEGAEFKGAANDPSYRCEGLQGPIIEIVKKLDKAISLVVSGHSHQGYTCKIDGRLVVQARSYGAYLTETTLTIDRSRNQVIQAVATNHLVDQSTYRPDPEAQRLVDQVASLTSMARNRPVATLPQPLTRKVAATGFDSPLGNAIADAQYAFAHTPGQVDVSFINAGSIRNDLPTGTPTQNVAVTYSDLYAVQPFGNNLIRMQLSGAQLLEVLQQQWQGHGAEDPQKLFVSDGFSYRWNPQAGLAQRVQDVRVHGQPLDLQRQYSVVVNNFLADGGDGFSVFKQGTQRQLLGRDLDALEAYLRQHGAELSNLKTDRVQRVK